MAAKIVVLDPPSPNYGPRRNGLRPKLVVLHYTAMASARAASQRLCDPAAEVSAHYLIGRDGEILQLVSEEQRAWHAGQGSWGGEDDINSRSIGIEIDNDGAAPFTASAMAALEQLLATILGRWSIPPQGVIGHSDMAPERKLDPGPRFDWRRLARQGLAVWPAEIHPQPANEAHFRAEATRFGYSAEVALGPLLDAFRARFRPQARGGLDATDMGLISDLAGRFRVDRRIDHG